MLLAVHRNLFRLTVSAIHLEVCLFVILTTVLGGWTLGAPIYLFAMASLVYFCPFRRRYIPYLFSALDIIVFVLLRVWSLGHTPYYRSPGSAAEFALYLYSALSCFAIILYAAFISGVSARVTRQALQDKNLSLTELANHDQLTGLLSRQALLNQLQESWTTCILAMGDIDDFKSINDTYGHNGGDYVLRTIAQLMREHCGNQADLCRWGGEEFLFLFSEGTMESASQSVCSLCRAIEAYPFSYQQQSFHVTMTFGLYAGGDSCDTQSLIHSADLRMYAGKARGKNQVICASVNGTP